MTILPWKLMETLVTMGCRPVIGWNGMAWDVCPDVTDTPHDDPWFSHADPIVAIQRAFAFQVSLRCKTCKWWKKNLQSKFGGCEHPKLSFEVFEEPEPQILDIAMGSSEYVFSIMTGPEFGCIHYELKVDG